MAAPGKETDINSMLNFKAVQKTDIEYIVAMMHDFYAIDKYPFDVEITKTLFKEFIADENLGKSYLIYHHKKLVGYFILSFMFSFEFKGRMAFLDELYICANARGKGFGSLTVDYIKKIAPELHIKMMYLEVENHNEMAQNLYLSKDFEFHNRKIMKHRI